MLRGSLDNFSLDEVMQLLSSTSKSGRLDLDGDRGRGTVTLSRGRLISASAAGLREDTPLEEVLFELLRYTQGQFLFTSGDVPLGSGSRSLAELLALAKARLADWKKIEAVVPSVYHMVAPADDLPADDVKINRKEWSTLRAIADGAAVLTVCEKLDVSEMDGSRLIKSLSERGLVEIGVPRSRDGSVSTDDVNHRQPSQYDNRQYQYGQPGVTPAAGPAGNGQVAHQGSDHVHPTVSDGPENTRGASTATGGDDWPPRSPSTNGHSEQPGQHPRARHSTGRQPAVSANSNQGNGQTPSDNGTPGQSDRGQARAVVSSGPQHPNSGVVPADQVATSPVESAAVATALQERPVLTKSGSSKKPAPASDDRSFFDRSTDAVTAEIANEAKAASAKRSTKNNSTSDTRSGSLLMRYLRSDN